MQRLRKGVSYEVQKIKVSDILDVLEVSPIGSNLCHDLLSKAVDTFNALAPKTL